MTGVATDVFGDRAEDLLDALLYGVSHDLRTPLLTLSLSAELIEEGLAPAGATGRDSSAAIEALRHGASDLERMLRALNALSRARRRPLERVAVPIGTLVGGHIVISEIDDLRRLSVAADPTPFLELVDELTDGRATRIEVTCAEGRARFRIAAPAPLPALTATPLMALAGSLQQHAGTVVEALAVAQILLACQGGEIAIEEGHVVVWLPLAGAA